MHSADPTNERSGVRQLGTRSKGNPETHLAKIRRHSERFTVYTSLHKAKPVKFVPQSKIPIWIIPSLLKCSRSVKIASFPGGFFPFS